MKKIIALLACLSSFIASAAEPEIKVTGKTETFECVVAAGEKVALPLNFVRMDTRLEATVSAKKFQSFELGRGNSKLYRSGWLEITDKEVIVYDVVLKNKTLQEDHALDSNDKKAKTARVNTPVEKGRFEHGLNMKKAKSVTVAIDLEHETAALTMTVGKQSFKMPLKDWWAGGEPFIKNLGKSDVKASLAFTRKTADMDTWFVGASYFNSASNGRWPYYMRKEGIDNWMADHLPGGSTQKMLSCFKDDLKFGTPKIAVWMMMGNNKSDTDVIDPVWFADTQEFISICKEKNITPILTIYPYIGKNHTLKSDWVRKSGYRYVDLWEAMCNEDGSWKDPAWLYKDNVHPTPEGAEVMWGAFKSAIPELK